MSLRIISLIASSTEMVCALGMEQQLVGRSHECDFPESVKSLPQCTEPKFQTDGSSYEIDERVKAILQEGLSVYRVHADTLQELRPDIIITQIQCKVCAVSEQDVQDAVRDIVGSKPTIISLNPNQLTDIWHDIQQVADALAISERGRELVSNLQKRMALIAKQTAHLSDKPRVACIEWIDPLMSGGNWLPELVSAAGGQNLMGKPGSHSPVIGWEELVQSQPDVIVVLPCGFDIKRTRQEMPVLTQHPGWSELPAVKNNRVYLADGNQYFNRPGPRVVESLECLVEMIHPSTQPKYRGIGWEPL